MKFLRFFFAVFLPRTQHPASKAFVEQLPVKKFTEENCEGECAICKCDWTPGEQGLDLPCHHVYHSDCIQKWFETSNRCPMCRYEVPTDDPEYERQRKAKEAEESQNSDPLHADQSSNTTQTHASSSNATNNHGASLNTSSAPPTRTTNGHTSSSSSSSSVQLTASQEALIADLLSEDSNSAVSQEPSSDHNTSQDFSSEYSMSQHPASYYSSSQDFMNSQSHDPSSEYSTAEDEEGEESSSSAFHSPTSPQSPMSPTDQPYEPNYSLD